VDLADLVYEHYVGECAAAHRRREVGAEANSHIERSIEVAFHWRSELVHRLTLHANEEGNRVAFSDRRLE
jgi:hypothetical protein